MNNLDNNQTHLTTQTQAIGLSELFRPVWIRRWKLLFFTFIITVIVALYLSLLRPCYTATATLQIGNNKFPSSQSSDLAFNQLNKDKIKTQYELIKSRLIAEKVISHLNLIENSEFNKNIYKDKIPFLANFYTDNKPSLDFVVDEFLKRLTVMPISETELVNITFRAYTPELAKRIANQIGLTYLQYQEESHSLAKASVSHTLEQHLEELRQKLVISELALLEYRETAGIIDIEGIVNIVTAELTQLTSSALEAEKHKDDLKITSDFIKNNKTNLQALIELSEVSNDVVYMELQQAKDLAKQKEYELAKRYGPRHPKRVALTAELELLDTRITKQINKIITSVEKHYLSAIEKAEANQTRLIKAKNDFLKLNRSHNQFFQLQREVETNKELYHSYLIRLKAADVSGANDKPLYALFIDKAILPKSPSAPNTKLYVAISFILSLAVISIIIMIRELFVDTLNSRRKLENFREASILAVLPKFKLANNMTPHSELEDDQFTESIRTLRTAILFNGEKKPPKVIAVTSSVANEGKSTVALHLARSFSEMEKVLLIEADLRHPTVAKNLNLDVHRPGLSNLLAKTHQINECLVRDKSVKLDILTSGISPANPLAFLSMKRFGVLIKVFSNFYDRIIIETPPVNAVSDAVIISKNVDSVIYVVHGTKTKREQITQGLRLLKQVNAPIEGVVINQSDNIGTENYQNKYYNHAANIIKLPLRKQM